jgi:hypothetical protein
MPNTHRIAQKPDLPILIIYTKTGFEQWHIEDVVQPGIG